MSELKEAEAFKNMLIEASTPLIAPHIEGVFAVFQLNHKPQTGWISVDEQLPSESGRYWCYVEYQSDLAKSSYQWNCFFGVVEKVFHVDGCGGRVTHWMPLPEPPLNKQDR